MTMSTIYKENNVQTFQMSCKNVFLKNPNQKFGIFNYY